MGKHKVGDFVKFSHPLSNGGTVTWNAEVVKATDTTFTVRHPERARHIPFSPVKAAGLYKYAQPEVK